MGKYGTQESAQSFWQRCWQPEAKLLKEAVLAEHVDVAKEKILEYKELDTGTLTKAGQETALTRTELRILEYLMKSPGRIYTKQQIFSYAWKDAYENEDTVDENSLMVHISNLRGKIEDDPKNPKILKTVKGLGYKLEKEKKDE